MALNFSSILFLLSTWFSHSFSGFMPETVKKYNIHGIDISHHQRDINWKVVAENHSLKVDFCFMKATEGITFKDTRFVENWAGSNIAGIRRGAYHFYITSADPRQQALNYIQSVKLEGGDMAPVLDFEQETSSKSVATVRQNLKTWLKIIERHYGISPIIYTNTHLFNKYIKGNFDDYPFWIANYNTTNIHNEVSHQNLKFWQYSEKGFVRGIKGNVDCNAFLGDAQEFMDHTL